MAGAAVPARPYSRPASASALRSRPTRRWCPARCWWRPSRRGSSSASERACLPGLVVPAVRCGLAAWLQAHQQSVPAAAQFWARLEWPCTHALARQARPPSALTSTALTSLVARYVGTPFPHNRKLADLGLHCYLKMLLKDNFIHADLVSSALASSPSSSSASNAAEHSASRAALRCMRAGWGHTGWVGAATDQGAPLQARPGPGHAARL